MTTNLKGVWADGQPAIGADVLRLLTAAAFTAGDSPLNVRGGIRYTVGNPGLVTAAPTGLAVRIQPFVGVVPGTETSTQAGYPVALLAQATENLTPADPTFPRIDLIVAKVVDAGAGSTFTIEPVTGMAFGAPFAPDAPANSLVLAEVLVNAGATSPTAITDRRTWLSAIEPPPTALTAEYTSDPAEPTTSETWAALANGPQGVFIAPASGKVLVTVAGRLRITAGGGWVGLSAQVDGPLGYQRIPNARDGIKTSEVSPLSDGGDQKANTFLVSGLTPGEEYSVTAVARVDDAATLCSTAERRILVVPVTA